MSAVKFQQKIYSVENRGGVIHYFTGLPDACPVCERGQNFEIPGYMRAGRSDTFCFAFFQCIFSDCRTPFFGKYELGTSSYFFMDMHVPSYTAPIQNIPEIIDVISPEYRAIYSQAHQAENMGLNLIAGPGYRKALEFLIKDYSIYLIRENSNDEATEENKKTIAEIKKAKLGLVIKEHLNMPRVKALASRATWLGNDETHYERRIENGDINIMKSLMRLSIHFIEAEEEAKKLEAEIQPVK